MCSANIKREIYTIKNNENFTRYVSEMYFQSPKVARYMGLPQSTVMSVVQVFKKEHRIHKKTATGRKRRLTTAQEFQLFEMSQERDNISVDEIRRRFLQQYPEFGHISKTTIYRTLERGKVYTFGNSKTLFCLYTVIALFLKIVSSLHIEIRKPYFYNASQRIVENHLV